MKNSIKILVIAIAILNLGKFTYAVNYERAFDQSKIFNDHKELMAYWGCSANVFDKNRNIINDPQIDYQKEKEKFQKACWAKLNSEKRWIDIKPIRVDITYLFVNILATKLILQIATKESFGGSFSVFATIHNALHDIKRIVECLFALAYRPENPLDDLEKQYVINRCFIPKELWPIIKEKFALASKNSFEMRNCMNFIKFALGLTIFKPQKSIKLNNNSELKVIFDKIDRFFNDYETLPEEITSIKVSLLKFIKNIEEKNNKSSRYAYLFGPGGIGKTYFVKQICDWINELLPNAIHFENISIDNPEELLGSSSNPGMFLKILRNQLQAKKLGTIVFMDEANWLNKPNIKNQAKCTLNGNMSEISTTYFGSGIDGAGIKIPMPPILIFAASNDEIKDQALKSRFDNFKFPYPKRETLIKHSNDIIKASYLYNLLTTEQKEKMIKELVTEIESNKDIKSFRDIEAITEPFMLKQLNNL